MQGVFAVVALAMEGPAAFSPGFEEHDGEVGTTYVRGWCHIILHNKRTVYRLSAAA